MKTIILVAINMACLLFFNSASASQIDASIQIRLESPVSGGIASGIANIQGWAIGTTAISHIELYVDDAKNSDVPYGGVRGDVGMAYPGYPGSWFSGFSMAVNFGNWSSGSHKFEVRAVDVNGNYNTASSTSTIVRFDSPYIADPASIDVARITGVTLVNGNTIKLKNVVVEGVGHNVTLSWLPGKQGFEIIAAEKLSSTTATYTLSVRSSGQTSVAITGAAALYSSTTPYDLDGINSGATVVLTAPSSSGGANFKNWLNCDSVVGTTCTVTVNGAKTITADYSTGTSFLPPVIWVSCPDMMATTISTYGNPEEIYKYDSGNYHSWTYWYWTKGFSRTFTWSNNITCETSDYSFSPVL